jgi:hypothetical protein
MANMELDISSEAVSAAALCKARQGVGTDAFEERRLLSPLTTTRT